MENSFPIQTRHYEYLMMPMEFSNSLAIFQNYTSNALRGYTDDFCVVYLDDILVFSETQEDHDQHLKLVME